MKSLLSTWLLTTLLVGLLGACGSSDAPGGVASPTTSGRAPTAVNTPKQTSTAQPTPTPPDRSLGELTSTAALPPKDSNSKPEIIAAQRPRVKLAPGTTRRTELVGGLNDFAFDMYRTVDKQEDNLIYSPYSIAMAFSMVYAGARGQTEAQIAKVLGFLPQKSHHPAANALERHLASLGTETRPTGEEGRDAFRLRTANALWGQRGYPFLDAFLATLAEQYGAGVRTVDFEANPVGGRRAVNKWVADQTKGRIRDILPKDVINKQTRLVLANAIYFKASWLYPFHKDSTRDGPFTLLDGTKVSVPMMDQRENPVAYAAGKDYQAVVLPYVGGTTAMVVILPKAGSFEKIEGGLNTGFFQKVRAEAGRDSATLTMPRFKFETSLDLADILPSMGMSDAFLDSVADFRGITEKEQLYISAALHRATIAVDEKGTEVTAATMIVVAEPGSASMSQPVHLTIDRPFMFAIVERETGAIVFSGRVMNPAK